MTPETFRGLALARPEAVESAHLGTVDFRVGGKIFATLGTSTRRPVVKLTPEEQELLTAADPEVFARADGRWGRFGWTCVALEKLSPEMAEDVLGRAWRNVAGRTSAQRA